MEREGVQGKAICPCEEERRRRSCSKEFGKHTEKKVKHAN